MFKRLRDGLLGRTEPDQQEISPTTISPDADETIETDETGEVDEVREAHEADESLPSETLPAATPPAALTNSVSALPEPVSSPPEQPDESVEPAELPGDDFDSRSEPDMGEQERRGFFRNPFKFSLGRTRQLFGQINAAFDEADDITDALWDELEETLISADVGVQTTENLMDTLRERVQAEGLKRGSELRDALKEELEILLGDPEPLVFSDTSPISVYLVVGVNGVGKTTTIAKLGEPSQKTETSCTSGRR